MKFFDRTTPKVTYSEGAKPFWSLDGKVALVTGATGWLGRPIVQGLLDAGAFVFVTSNSDEKLSNLTDDLDHQRHSTKTIRCNIFEQSELEVLVQSVIQIKNRLDILVNNAIGATAQSDLLDAHSRAKINLAPNLEALWNLTTLATPLLKKSARETGDASIINIASMYGKISPDPKIYESTGVDPNPVFYGATKAAVIQMTKWFACNLGESAIRVNSISPGAFPQRETQINNPQFIEALAKRIPLGRIGRPEEISGVVTFLASQASSYITGSDISVDGGWTSR